MKIRFGMLAVDAYGKAGGQCIQRRGGLRVLRNITIPTQRIASTQNPQRFINSQLFNKWQFLSKAERDEWGTVASFLPRVNGWGDSKTINGREAYNSLNSIVMPFDVGGVDPYSVTYEIPSLTLGTFLISKSISSMDFYIDESSDYSFCQIKALQLRSSAVNPSVVKLKTYDRINDISDNATNWENFLLAFPNVQVGNVFSVAIRPVSVSGLAGPWIQQTVKVV